MSVLFNREKWKAGLLPGTVLFLQLQQLHNYSFVSLNLHLTGWPIESHSWLEQLFCIRYKPCSQAGCCGWIYPPLCLVSFGGIDSSCMESFFCCCCSCNVNPYFYSVVLADVCSVMCNLSVPSPPFRRTLSVSLQLFQWKRLENLYFREKKFSVEVNDPHRSEDKPTYFIFT